MLSAALPCGVRSFLWRWLGGFEPRPPKRAAHITSGDASGRSSDSHQTGARGEIRTLTAALLRRGPLPLGLPGHKTSGAGGEIRTPTITPLKRVPLSVGPRLPVWCRPRDSNPHYPGFEAGASADWATTANWSDRGDSHPRLSLGKAACCSYNTAA